MVRNSLDRSDVGSSHSPKHLPTGSEAGSDLLREQSGKLAKQPDLRRHRSAGDVGNQSPDASSSQSPDFLRNMPIAIEQQRTLRRSRSSGDIGGNHSLDISLTVLHDAVVARKGNDTTSAGISHTQSRDVISEARRELSIRPASHDIEVLRGDNDIERSDKHSVDDARLLLERRLQERHRGKVLEGDTIKEVADEAHDIFKDGSHESAVDQLRRAQESIEKELKEMVPDRPLEKTWAGWFKRQDFSHLSPEQKAQYQRLTALNDSLKKGLAELEKAPAGKWSAVRRGGVIVATSGAIAGLNNIYPSLTGHQWKWGGLIGGMVSAGFANQAASFVTKRFFGGEFIPGGALTQTVVGVGAIIVTDKIYTTVASAIAHYHAA